MNQYIRHYLVSLVFLMGGLLFAQQTIQGLVTDESGVPLPGATVVVEGTSDGTTTDFDGNFSISATDGQNLLISFVGYQTLTVAVGADA
ncbi:MAG: carboxypeptidase-like regulatory domain-containing protein, partial [Flavobacteriaceae bacterium]